MPRPTIALLVLLAASAGLGCEKLLKGDETESESEQAPVDTSEPEEKQAEPTALPEAGTSEGEGAVIDDSTPSDPDKPSPTPTPQPTPQPTPKPTTTTTATPTATPTATATATTPKLVQCTTKCQAALQQCLTPKPGQLPDAAQCQSGFSACVAACQ
jgi:hypothetical protein